MWPLLLAMTGLSQAQDLVNAELEDGFEFAVALGADLGSQRFSACTGSLITPEIILTAAHCSADLPMDVVVLAGRAFFGPSLDDAVTVGFSDGWIHPDYVPLQNGIGGTLGRNDVGILVLSEPVDFVEPVWFATASIDDAADGAVVTSVGFGVTDPDGGGSGVKRSAELTVDSVDSTFVYSSSSTNVDGANVCSGDSGGPQVHWDGERWVQWAVHSWADVSCATQSGSTRVDTVSEWILDQIEDVHGSRDRCEVWGRYGDGACDLDCEVEDVDCLDPAEASYHPPEATGEKASGCNTVGRGAGWAIFALLGIAGRKRRRCAVDGVCLAPRRDS
jgi:V8-like Glu-specific endopeptidase